MYHLVPRFVLEKLAQGTHRGRFAAVSLFVDISGFTSTSEALMKHGKEGAEVLANLMQAVFDPLVDHVYQQGGFITGLAGDAFTALFPKSESTAYPRAFAAALRIQQHLAAQPVQRTAFGEFSFAGKLGLADGHVEWGIVQPGDADRSVVATTVSATYYFAGPAIDACAAAEHEANAGELILSAPTLHVLSPLLSAAEVNGFYRVQSVNRGLPGPQLVPAGPPKPDMSALFVPPIIRQQTVRGEFRQVLTLFINLKDIQDADHLEMFLKSVFRLQGQYGGYINRVDFGDKGCNLLLFWGMPISFENDIERALRFISALPTLFPGTIRAGLTYRTMYAGFVGASTRMEYACYGRGVNIAARLMTEAPWGEIWVDDEVARRSETLYELESLGTKAFRGLSEPLAVYAVAKPREAVEPSFQGNIVARQQELDQLEKFVLPIYYGHFAGTLLVDGEPGIGKSRIIHEFQRRPRVAMAVGAFVTPQWAVCQVDQILRQSLNPFRSYLARYFEQSDVQVEGRNKRRFIRKLEELIASTADDELATELTRTRSFLAALLGLYWPDSLYSQVGPKIRFENILGALKTFFKAESLRQPIILHLEDAQWLDTDSVHFLNQFVNNIDEFPIAIILTARDMVESAVNKLSFPRERLTLGPLAEEGLANLAFSVLGQPASHDLIRLLVERTEGNPFFAEQILLYLRDNDLRVNELGEYEPGQTGFLLPNDVRTVLIARLDRLSHDVREVVQTAAVLGREFEARLLKVMPSLGEDIDAKIETAARAAIWLPLGDGRFRFNHTLLRDAAYDMQLQARRLELHKQAAETLERLHADDLEPYFGLLAYHYEQAEVVPQAISYLEKAGDLAREAYQNELAVEYYSRAFALTPESELAESYYNLLLARERVYDVQGDREKQNQDLRALLALTDALATSISPPERAAAMKAAVLIRQAHHAEMLSDYRQAVETAQQAIALAKEGNDQYQEAVGYLRWGRSLANLGEYAEARQHLSRALELARRFQHVQLEARSMFSLGTVNAMQGDYMSAATYYVQALSIFREIGDRLYIGWSLNNLGATARELGDYAGARRYHEEHEQICREIGDRRGEAFALSNLGRVAAMHGQYVVARTYYEKGLHIYRAIGERISEGQTLSSLALAARHQGQFSLAHNYWEQALRLFREIKDRRGEAVTFNSLGGLFADLGQYKRSFAYIQQALKVAETIGNRGDEGTFLLNLALVHLQTGQNDAAKPLLDRALAIATDLQDQNMFAGVMLSSGRYHRQRGEWALARAAYEEAVATRRESGNMPYLAEALAGLALTQSELGEQTLAMRGINELLTVLEKRSLEGAWEPFEVYWSCYLVLQRNLDFRSQLVLQRAYDLLQEWSQNIKDPAQRQSFLATVKTNQMINEAFPL